MSPQAFVAKWAGEASVMRQRAALVDGAALIGEMLRDFDAVMQDYGEELLNLAQTPVILNLPHLGRSRGLLPPPNRHTRPNFSP